MKKVIRLTENELINLVKRIIKEDEDQWAADSQEMEGESDFSRMDIQQMPEFQKLVRILKRNPEAAMELQSELGDGLNEEYEYMAVSYTHLTLPTILRV